MQNMMGLLKTARDMQKNMKAAQKELAKTIVTGASSNGAIEINMACNHQVKQVVVSEELKELNTRSIEKLIEEALKDALKKIDAKNDEIMKPLKKGLPSIPGFGF
jgi:nucleoid-associated protein EbfC